MSVKLKHVHLVSEFPEMQKLLCRSPLRSRRKILTLLTPLNPHSKEISSNSASFFTTHQNPRGALYPCSLPLDKWHEIKQLIIPSVAQHDKKARVPRRFSSSHLQKLFGKEMRFPQLLCQKQEVWDVKRQKHLYKCTEACPVNLRWPHGHPGGAFFYWNLMQEHEVTPVHVLPSPDERIACYKYCQHPLRGFTLLNTANTNKRLRAELAHRALAFGLLTNELPIVHPFNFIKLPRQFQLKVWVKRHTAVFFQRPHREKAHSSV